MMALIALSQLVPSISTGAEESGTVGVKSVCRLKTVHVFVVNVSTSIINVMMTKGITYTAAKRLYRTIVERHKTGEDTSKIDAAELAEEMNLWMPDEWTHLGYCIVACLENTKLVVSLQKGQTKVLDALLGKAMKASEMTLDAEVTREILPWVIETYF